MLGESLQGSPQKRDRAVDQVKKLQQHIELSKMTRILLTGGSGFVAAHVLDILLKNGHSVVTTVRTREKAELIQAAHPKSFQKDLSFVIVKDIAVEGAFDEAVKSDPPFEAVIHTASPFHYNAVDVQKELIDPAVLGTTGILKAIKSGAPHVKRVVITSSFAAMMNTTVMNRPGHVYNEDDWNAITQEEAVKDAATGYRASKTFAEKAAWKFVEDEKPSFTLSIINPPLVLGPVVPYLDSLTSINTSNQRIRDIYIGKAEYQIAETGVFLWVDVRDLALAHVRAAELEAAGGQRFFVAGGAFSNKEIADSIRKQFPSLPKLPSDATPGGRYPEDGVYTYDNRKTRDLLGIVFGGLDKCIKDTVLSFLAMEAAQE